MEGPDQDGHYGEMPLGSLVGLGDWTKEEFSTERRLQ